MILIGIALAIAIPCILKCRQCCCWKNKPFPCLVRKRLAYYSTGQYSSKKKKPAVKPQNQDKDNCISDDNAGSTVVHHHHYYASNPPRNQIFLDKKRSSFYGEIIDAKIVNESNITEEC